MDEESMFLNGRTYFSENQANKLSKESVEHITISSHLQLN